MLLWPEAAVPKMIRYDEETFRSITGLAQSNHVWMIIGSDDAEARLNSTNPDDGDYFNSSFLVSPEGKLANVYHKRNLVIFGEYIPLIRWLPFVKARRGTFRFGFARQVAKICPLKAVFK